MDQKTSCPSQNTGRRTGRAGRGLFPGDGSFKGAGWPGRIRPAKYSATDCTAHGSAPTWMGTCAACAAPPPRPPDIVVADSGAGVRARGVGGRGAVACPICGAMAGSRCWITDTVMRSGVMALIYIEKTLAVYFRRSV